MGEVDFYVLPEGCITSILSFTSPRDACTSSLVSLIFKSAADSDVVWEKFLPSDYKEIISRCVDPSSLNFSSKKELYVRLCGDPILVDDGKKKDFGYECNVGPIVERSDATQRLSLSFKLEKVSGKKCYMIGARELRIVWGDSPQYWKWREGTDSRFSEVAQLVSVCWFEMHGKIDTRVLSHKTTYVAYFVIRFVEGAYGLDHPLAEVSVKFANGGSGASGDRSVCLDPHCNTRPPFLAPHRIGLIRRRFGHMFGQPVSRRGDHFPRERGDGWLEIELGEFFVNNGEDGEVEMSIFEVKGGHWKAGLIVQGIELRPKTST